MELTTTPSNNSTTFIQYVDEDDMEEPSESDALTKNHSGIEPNFQQPSTSSGNISDSELDEKEGRKQRERGNFYYSDGRYRLLAGFYSISLVHN